MTRVFRWLTIAHRYLGLVLSIPMLAWVLSGMVMIYVGYPALREDVRLGHLTPLDWDRCCTVADGALADDAVVDRAQVEMLGDRPILRLRAGAIDLASGQRITAVGEDDARLVASSYGTVAAMEMIAYDQWTVAGGFNRDRPLYRVTLAGPDGRQVYVSGTTGKVVQATNRRQRFWNWLGAVPHWIYFADLRRDAALWSQTVVWTSLTGGVLTLTGMIIGIRQFRRRASGRWSPYRGWTYWHHVPGVIFGLFALTWVVSGMLSMNPWGALEGGDATAERAQLRGLHLTGTQLRQALRDLAATRPGGAVSFSAAPFDGALAFIAFAGDGSRTRLDAVGAPTTPAVMDRAAVLLGGGDLQRLDKEDDYYFPHHGEIAPLPAYRLIQPDGRRFYVDPLSGELLGSVDAADRGYRWLYQAPHRLDFTPWLRARPVRDLVMLPLLAGVALSFATGLYLTVRWVRRRWRA
ncbi:PepSY-associated transmembrane protein [Nitrospirillum amazonense]|uniref:PepSY-associated transmembrane protein n=1 Tax=Nitrospirillum amazonense TaxID=28077 RepID=A0A560FP61_9PROT|nr:peptidase [Nitrospirillum amazonense]TWB23416.1 PepSY-associated transmembrane protein [Nitrospirillum amazonense]